jgi:hypothetical protein
VLKQTADLPAPCLTSSFNLSISTGQFSMIFKEAFITPIIKQAGMYAADVNSYRPISNLSVLSKLLERPIARQLYEIIKVSPFISFATVWFSVRPFN